MWPAGCEAWSRGCATGCPADVACCSKSANEICRGTQGGTWCYSVANSKMTSVASCKLQLGLACLSPLPFCEPCRRRSCASIAKRRCNCRRSLPSKCRSATFFLLEVHGQVLVLMILELVSILEVGVAAATHVSINWFLHWVVTI